jgi:hypothetical protein
MVDRDSSLLQQGADITGGVYRRIDPDKHFGALLQVDIKQELNRVEIHQCEAISLQWQKQRCSHILRPGSA